MKAVLHFSVGAYVMLTSILWTTVGLYNGANGTVVDSVYMDSEGPRNGGVPEALAVQFRDLAKITDIDPFLEGYEQSVEIPMKQVEWKHGALTLT